MSKLTRLSEGKKYKLLADYTDILSGLFEKGTILTFTGQNLGYAKFRVKWKDIAIPPKQAFKILEEVTEQLEGR